MRISDIVVETGVLGQIKQDYDRGYNAVDRILNLKRWAEKSGKAQTGGASNNNLDVKDAVQAVIQGKRIYEDQRQTLLKLAQQLKADQIQTQQNSQQVAAILKYAAEGKPLNDQQRAVLTQFLKER